MTRRDNPLLAWHASPYDLPEGRFGEMRQVSGKGQGAASYGRGAAYVAENPKVSGPGESEYMKEFQRHPAIKRGEKLFGVPITKWVDGLLLSDLHSLQRAQARRDFNTKFHAVLPQYSDDPHLGRDAAQKIMESIRFFPTSPYGFVEHHLSTHTGESESTKLANKIVMDHVGPSSGTDGPYSYKVALHLGDDTLLDWDETYKNHHNDARGKIEKAFQGSTAQPMDAGMPGSAAREMLEKNQNVSGSTIYRLLEQYHGSDFAATEALLKAGIHGIRYKDAGSRGYQPAAVLLDGKDIGRDHPVQAPVSEKQYLDMLRTVMEGTGLRDLQEAADQVKKHAENWFANPGNAVRDHIYQSYANAAQWYNDNKHRVELRAVRPTYNYVVFHPDFIEALEQYDIHGKRVKAFAPKGVKLKSVDHDPFEGEDR